MDLKTKVKIELLVMTLATFSLGSYYGHFLWPPNPKVVEVQISPPAASQTDVDIILTDSSMAMILKFRGFQLTRAMQLAVIEENNDIEHIIELDGYDDKGNVKLVEIVEYVDGKPVFIGGSYVR